MESALIVTGNDKSVLFLKEQLTAASYGQIAVLHTCGEVRRLLVDRAFDLVVINAPLKDESGESLAVDIAAKNAGQVVLVVKSEFFEEVAAVTEDAGVLTVAKPVNKAVFRSAVKLAQAAQSKLRRVQQENGRLKQKIEDIRIIDRAKCILISHLRLDEQEAHRYIEKEAMDLRRTKRAVAEQILKTYEN